MNGPNTGIRGIAGLDGKRRRFRQDTALFSFNWIDLHHHFKNEQGYMKKVLTDDGLHLNDAGYQLWAKVLKPYLVG